MTTDQVLMNALTRACRLRNDIAMTRLPIKYNLLRSILTTLSDVFEKQPYLHILYKAMFLTMYYGLLRVGEVTYSEHVVKAADVQIGVNKQKLMFILRSSKTHTKGDKPQIIKISADEGNDVISSRRIKSNENIANCPFQAVRAYLAMRRRMHSSKNEPFFIFRDRTPVHAHHFRTVLRDCITKFGLEASLYGTHSLRAGRAVDMLEMGVDIETIKHLGRWKSNAVYAYLR